MDKSLSIVYLDWLQRKMLHVVPSSFPLDLFALSVPDWRPGKFVSIFSELLTDVCHLQTPEFPPRYSPLPWLMTKHAGGRALITAESADWIQLDTTSLPLFCLLNTKITRWAVFSVCTTFLHKRKNQDPRLTSISTVNSMCVQINYT